MIRIISLFIFINITFGYSQNSPQSVNINTQSKTLDKVVAVVDDQMILLSDIADMQKKQLNHYVIDSCASECEVLKKMIATKMYYAKALKDSITVNEEEVNNEIDRKMEYFVSIFGNEKKLEKYFDKTINELKISLKEDIEKKMRADRTRMKVLSQVNPTPKEVKNYFESIPKDKIPYYNSEVQLGQIVFIPKISRENKRKAKEKIESIYKELISGTSEIGTQAILYSDDPGSAANGGELGWVEHGVMVPEFEQAAFNTPIGKFSDIVETKYGYHVLQIMDKKNDKVRVKHILVTPKMDADGLDKVKYLADSIRTKIQNHEITFEKAVELYSDDIYFKSYGGIIMNFKNRTSFFEINQIDPEIVETVNKMNPGDISDPMPYQSPDRKVGYRIIKLISETAPHKASLQLDYATIKNDCEQKMQEDAENKWIKFYKDFVYIKIDPFYSECKELLELKQK